MTPTAPRFIFRTPEEVENLPDLEWLIPDILPKPCLAVLYGEPGCGKTFVALSMALTVGNGGEWAGRQTIPAKVLYFAAEGIYGLKTRISAYRKNFDIAEDSVVFSGDPINVLAPRDDGDSLIAELEYAQFSPDVIIMDTLARVMVDGDENSSRDMGRAVEGLDRLKTAFNAVVLVIHHTAKNGRSERGSSALRGAADVMIECKESGGKTGRAVKLECTKMKDAEPFTTVTASLDKIELPNGATSLVLGGRTAPASVNPEKNAGKILDLLKEKFAETGATNGQLLAAFEDAGFGGKSTFIRALRELKDAEEVRQEETGKGARYFSLGVSPKSVS